jgi:hypothetical protein
MLDSNAKITGGGTTEHQNLTNLTERCTDKKTECLAGMRPWVQSQNTKKGKTTEV